MTIANLSDSQKAEAVAAFDARFGEMDRVLWCLSKSCRASLTEGSSSEVVETLVWTVKSWWRVQGVRSETRELMAQGLASLDWSTDMFELPGQVPDDADEYACYLVSTLVEHCQKLGVKRREFSLASKVLHWLLPWQIPAYDSFVRRTLDVPSAWDLPVAYMAVAQKIFESLRELESIDPAWLGTIEPRSLLRGFDKCLWWIGGGNQSTNTFVNDPWGVVSHLGLTRGDSCPDSSPTINVT